MSQPATDDRPTLAVLGGTGDLGGGLACRWARAGYTTIVGSRTEDKAVRVASELSQSLPEGVSLLGLDNLAAANRAEIAVLTVPFAHQRSTLEGVREALLGKILVDCTVPLQPPKVGRVQLPPEGCAALIAQQTLGDGVRVVSAFQNVGAAHLRHEEPIDCDVLVAGDDVEARAQVVALVEAAGLRGFHVGPLCNAAASEALTSVLIQINKKYGIAGAGIRITGEPTRSP